MECNIHMEDHGGRLFLDLTRHLKVLYEFQSASGELYDLRGPSSFQDRRESRDIGFGTKRIKYCKILSLKLESRRPSRFGNSLKLSCSS